MTLANLLLAVLIVAFFVLIYSAVREKLITPSWVAILLVIIVLIIERVR